MFGWDRGYFRILPVFLSLAVGSGCASFSNRPTSVMVQSLLATERKVVTFTLAGAPKAIEQRIIQRASACVEGVLKSSGVVPAGPGVLVPVSSSMHQRLEEGTDADGSRWLALRMDGLIHAVAFGLRLRSQDVDSVEIKAFPADHRKPGRIKELVASGEIFCAWREVSYPYD